MQTGFYRMGNMESALQHLDIAGIIIDAYQYLHGCCDDFALGLNNLFGYKIILWTEISTESGHTVLIHAFNVFKFRGKDYYVDIRGITDSINDIISEFDYYEEPSFITYDRNEAVKKLRSMGISTIVENEPRHIIEQFRSFYNI